MKKALALILALALSLSLFGCSPAEAPEDSPNAGGCLLYTSPSPRD